MALQKKRSLVAGRTNAERIDDAVKRKAVFLAAYEEWGTIKKACEAAGMDEVFVRPAGVTNPDQVDRLAEALL